jgi:hypothetical protein
MAARMPINATTKSNSTSVKPRLPDTIMTAPERDSSRTRHGTSGPLPS